MLVPCGLSKKDRESYNKENIRSLSKDRKTRTGQNKHPGLRSPKVAKAEAKKSGSSSRR